MRRLLIIALLLVASGDNGADGRILPLTSNDIRLMLRAGYASEVIQKELATRRFAGSCDAATEKFLIEAGAGPGLIDALKNGSYQSSPADAQKAQEELAAQARRHALEAEQSRKFNTLYQDQLRRARTAASSPGAVSAVADLTKGDLVSWKEGGLAPFDDTPMAKKKLIALYFSAHWCSPCKKFTPQLVEFYNRVAPQHPEFEVIFISHDHSPGEMETYMREAQMPWPAVEFGKLPGKAALKKYEGDGIPCLVVLDAGGKVLSDSYVEKKYVGPEKVLADLNAIFSTGSTATTASR